MISLILSIKSSYTHGYNESVDITIIAHPNSKNPRVETDLIGTTHIYIKEPPLEGKANKAISEALANHLKIKKNQLILVRGEKSKIKVFKVI